MRPDDPAPIKTEPQMSVPGEGCIYGPIVVVLLAFALYVLLTMYR